MDAGTWFTFSIFIESRTPAHGMVLPRFRVSFPALEMPSQTGPDVCLLGDSTSNSIKTNRGRNREIKQSRNSSTLLGVSVSK